SDAAFRGGACPTPEYTIAYTGNYTTSADANEETVQEWALSLPEKGASTLRSLERANGGSSSTEITELSEALNELNEALRIDPVGPEALYPVERWKRAVTDCYAAVRSSLSWVYTLP